MSISPDTPRAYRAPAPLPDAGVAKTPRAKAELPENKARREPAPSPTKTQRAPAPTPEKNFEFEVTRDWKGRTVKYSHSGENLSIDETITRLQTRVLVIRHKDTSEAEKGQLKKEIKAMMLLIKSDPGFFDRVYADGINTTNKMRLNTLDNSLNHINFYPKEVMDALIFLHLDRIPPTKILLSIGYSYRDRTTPEQYQKVVEAVKTISDYKTGQKKAK